MASRLEIVNLRAGIEGKEILKGIDLSLEAGEVHALMGPNGSGKSTLAYVLLGHPRYRVLEGQVLLDGEDVLRMETDERARKGLFLGFQYPMDVPGVKMSRFLKRSHRHLHPDAGDGETFRARVRGAMDRMGMDESFLNRYVNQGFSGGEKKRAEAVQMAIFEPRFAIMDETDSGLDIDSLQIVSEALNDIARGGTGILLITHYQRILRYVDPTRVHVLLDGRIVRSGGEELAGELEARGYDWLREEA